MTGNKPMLTVNTTTAGSAQAVAVPQSRPMLEPGELEEFLLTCRPSVPVLSVDGLDGYLTALLIGPKFIDPRLWLGRLFGEQALIAEADTRDHLAIQAVVAHYNRLSVTLSDLRINTGRCSSRTARAAWTLCSGGLASPPRSTRSPKLEEGDGSPATGSRPVRTDLRCGIP